MNKREKFLKEIAEVINRNSLEAHFNDTPDYILAQVAVEAMGNFAEASARRDNWTGSKKPISRARLCGMRIATIARFGGFARNVGPTNTWSPWSIRSRRRSTSQRRCKQCRKGTHGINAGQITKGKGATMGKSNCPG